MKQVLRSTSLVILATIAASKNVGIRETSADLIERSLLAQAPPTWPIKNGYVAFGDSYAAGMGTGDTSTDACRIGSNNYGNLLHKYTNNSNVDYQARQCSGDTVLGLAKQIEKWASHNPGRADLATLSIGGNDANFADFVINCIITPHPVVKRSEYRERCLKTEAEADNYLRKDKNDETGLRFKLRTQYTSIMRYSGRKDFHLYVTGYPRFFEAESKDCDDTTFYYWRPGYKTWGWPIWLTQDLRREINRKVELMNQVIQDAIRDANEGVGAGRIHFVDVNPKFDMHRWCEFSNPTHEPDENREQTWFFLSGWKDFAAPEQNIATASRSQSQVTFESLQLPDASTCQQSLDKRLQTTGSIDPEDRYKCAISKSIAEDPQGDAAVAYNRALDASNFGSADLHSQDITGWFSTTERIKTFHPRTRGMIAYRDAIIEAINTHQKGKRACGYVEPPWPTSASNGLPAPGSNALPALGDPDSSNSGQQIALASYINPSASPDLWDRMIADPKVSVLVMNVLNGPDTEKSTEWADVIKRAKAANKKVLGYVRTGYLGLSPADSGPFEPFETRDGSHKISDWIAQVQRDVDQWYSFYQAEGMGGIFFDESHNECGPNNRYAELYRFVSENTKRKHPGAMTVINPGTAAPQCYEESADTILSFESNYTSYTTGTYAAVDWIPKDPRKLWHIIYDVPENKIAEVAALARKNHAGLVEITDAQFPNPYGSLPSPNYMQNFGSAVSGGVPLIKPYSASSDPTKPSSLAAPALSVKGHEYTSISLEWTYAGSQDPYAFTISNNSDEVVRVPGYMRDVTVGGFTPGTKGLEFQIRAVEADGRLSGPSNNVASSTDMLVGAPIRNIQITTGAKETTYEADIYIPSGFVRMFFTDDDSHDKNWPGWPVDFNGGYVIAHHLIEGRTMFKYAGAKEADAKGNREWRWDQIGARDNVKVIRNKYHYKWILPVTPATLNFDPTTILIQLDGYTTRKNHFQPCPRKWKNGAYTCSGDPPPGKPSEGEPPAAKPSEEGSSFDCEGSRPMCSIGLQILKYCNEAVNTLARGPTGMTYVSSTDTKLTGNCKSNALEGCKVFVQGQSKDGSRCAFTGDEMYWAYQDIRKKGGCGTCGTKHFANGCMVSIDYEPDCKWFGKSSTGYRRIQSYGRM